MKTLATKYSYAAYVVACMHARTYVRIYINIHHDYVGYNYKYIYMHACTHVQVYVYI